LLSHLTALFYFTSRFVYLCLHLLFLFFLPLCTRFLLFFFFNDTATTEIYTLSLHDALPISAAAVVTGCSARGPQILDTTSYLFPHSLDAMGFDLKESGFHIVLSKDVPQLIREKIKSLVSSFLGRHGLCREQISSFILHPGGQKLLVYMEEELGLSRADTQISWDVLCDYGNLSSASVLFVLHECLNKRNASAGEYGLLAAFGPGFSSEMLLLRWA